MLKDQIKVGNYYRATVSGKKATLRVDEIIENDGRTYTRAFDGGKTRIRGNTRYCCTNIATGRIIIVKSAAKFICGVIGVKDDGNTMPKMP